MKSNFHDIAYVHSFFSSSNKCEAVGHRPTVFSDDHDEDGSHQAHRIHGVSEKVREPVNCPTMTEKWP